MLGRTKVGYHVQDPLVSLRHAELWFDGDRITLKDLGSATGTWLGDEAVPTDRAIPVQVGSKFRLGDTWFILEDGNSDVARAVITGLLAAILVLMIAILVMAVVFPPFERSEILVGENVRFGVGEGSLVPVPTRFLRERSLSVRQLRVRRVSDFDENKRDELWLVYENMAEVVTFDAEGDWVTLGKLPSGCIDRKGTVGFPDQSCDGVEYHFRDGRYRVAIQDGVVAWMPYRPPPVEEADSKPAEPAPATPGVVVPVWQPPTPFRFSLIRQESLAGFLSERGVDVPVHYLVCEGAFPGARAQVLTETGEIVPLAYGCVRNMSLIGPQRTAWFGTDLPLAVAFTAAGHRALIDDLSTWFGGSPDGAFLSPEGQWIVDTANQPPVPRAAAIRLAFDASTMPTQPVASESILPTGYRHWVPSPGKTAPSADAVRAVFLTEGTAVLDPPGCSRLEVSTGPWLCGLTRGCSSLSTFVSVQEVGCEGGGVVLSASYGGGTTYGASTGVDVVANVTTIRHGLQWEVLGAEVAWRPRIEKASPDR